MSSGAFYTNLKDWMKAKEDVDDSDSHDVTLALGTVAISDDDFMDELTRTLTPKSNTKILDDMESSEKNEPSDRIKEIRKRRREALSISGGWLERASNTPSDESK